MPFIVIAVAYGLDTREIYCNCAIGIQRLRIKFCWFCMCVPADSVLRTMTAAVCVSAQDLLLDLIDPEYRSQLFFDFDLTD